MQKAPQKQYFISINGVKTRYGVGTTAIYRWMDDERVNMPRPYKLGPRCVRWKLTELEAWEKSREVAA